MPEATALRVDMRYDPDTDVKLQLLLPFYAFLEAVKDAHDQTEDERKRPSLSALVVKAVEAKKPPSFKKIFEQSGEIYPALKLTPLQCLQALCVDDHFLHLTTSLYSHMRTRVQTSVRQQDYRLHADHQRGDETALAITLHLSTYCMGYDAVAQALVRLDGSREFAWSAGISPALDLSGVCFLEKNDRLLARTFPTSIMLRCSAVSKDKYNLRSVYTYAGRARAEFNETL
jgi:hypothetical protein